MPSITNMYEKNHGETFLKSRVQEFQVPDCPAVSLLALTAWVSDFITKPAGLGNGPFLAVVTRIGLYRLWSCVVVGSQTVPGTFLQGYRTSGPHLLE